MADARFEINAAIEMLREAAALRLTSFKADAERLEVYLLEAFAAREPKTVEMSLAEHVHVFEFDNRRGEVPVGAQLTVMAYGETLGRSLVAPAIRSGRYRAVLMLTRIDDEPPRR